MLPSEFASVAVAGFMGAAVLAAATAPGATSAFATHPDDQVTVRLSVKDLNMTSEAGAQEALARIRQAAKAICGDSGSKVSLSQQIRLRSCVETTVGRTVAASNLPTLIAVSSGGHVATMASGAG